MSKFTILSFTVGQKIRLNEQILEVLKINNFSLEVICALSGEIQTISFLDLATYDCHDMVDFSENLDNDGQSHYVSLDKFSEDSFKKYFVNLRLMRFMARLPENYSWKSPVFQTLYQRETLVLSNFFEGFNETHYPQVTYVYQLFRKFVRSGFQLLQIRSKGAKKAPWSPDKKRTSPAFELGQKILETETINGPAHLHRRIKEKISMGDDS